MTVQSVPAGPMVSPTSDEGFFEIERPTAEHRVQRRPRPEPIEALKFALNARVTIQVSGVQR
jgi:hypothetical protein